MGRSVRMCVYARVAKIRVPPSCQKHRLFSPNMSFGMMSGRWNVHTCIGQTDGAQQGIFVS